MVRLLPLAMPWSVPATQPVQSVKCILTAGKSSQLASVMRQTHTPGPLTKALALALCSHLVWAGPQQDQRDGNGKGKSKGIHCSFINITYQFSFIRFKETFSFIITRGGINFSRVMFYKRLFQEMSSDLPARVRQ